MGLESGQYFRAIDSFTITTHGAVEESRESKGTALQEWDLEGVEKIRADGMENGRRQLSQDPVFGLVSSVKSVPWRPPDKGGVSEIAADWTPGNCERRSRSWSNTKGSRGLGRTMAIPPRVPSSLKYSPVGSSQFERQQVFRVKAGIDTASSRMKVLTMRPVPVSSTSAMAMVETTRTLLRRWRENPAVVARPESLSMVVKLRLEPCMAGMSPNSKPVRMESNRGECEHATVNGEVVEIVLRPVSRQYADAAIGDQERERRAQHGEHDRFGQKLEDQTPAARTQGGAHHDFVLPRGQTGQEQSCYVGAGKQKHESDCALQREQAFARVAYSCFRYGDERHSPSLVPFRIFLGEVRGDSRSSPLVPVRARCRP